MHQPYICAASCLNNLMQALGNNLGCCNFEASKIAFLLPGELWICRPDSFQHPMGEEKMLLAEELSMGQGWGKQCWCITNPSDACHDSWKWVFGVSSKGEKAYLRITTCSKNPTVSSNHFIWLLPSMSWVPPLDNVPMMGTSWSLLYIRTQTLRLLWKHHISLLRKPHCLPEPFYSNPLLPLASGLG